MELSSLIAMLLIGAISGWLAGSLWKGGGFGLVGNILVGIIGSFVGGWLLTKVGMNLNLGSSLVNIIVQSVLGAVVVLWLAGMVRKVTS